MYSKTFYIIYLLIGLTWIRSSTDKIFGGKFVDLLGGLLTKIADKNPYPWYKAFLQNVAIPNSQIFAQLTMWGEFLTAFSITLGSFYLLYSRSEQRLGLLILLAGLIGGLFLNATFWLGFGYANVATDSLNLLMFAIELVGIITLISILK